MNEDSDRDNEVEYSLPPILVVEINVHIDIDVSGSFKAMPLLLPLLLSTSTPWMIDGRIASKDTGAFRRALTVTNDIIVSCGGRR